MSDEELDAAIAERFKVYEAGTHLPDAWADRHNGHCMCCNCECH